MILPPQPPRNAPIAASANKTPPLSCTTTSHSSGRLKAGKAALASAPVRGPSSTAPAASAAARDSRTMAQPAGPASSTRLGSSTLAPLAASSACHPAKA